MAVKRTQARLGADVYVRDRTRAGLSSVQRGFNSTMSGLGRTAGTTSQALAGAISGNAMLASAAGAGAMLTFAASAGRAFAEVEMKWAEVTTLMPNQTQAATDKMFQQIRDFSRKSGFEIRDSLQATYQAVSAGIDPANTESFLAVAGQAARGGIANLTTAVDALTTVLNAYGQETGKATDRSDELFTAIRLGKTTFQELAPVMGPVLPIAASLNTEFAEIMASVAALTAQGNPTAIAMTQIRSALVALTKDTEAKSIFENLFGMTYAEYQQQGGTLQEALTAIKDEVERQGGSITQAFGRVEAASAALGLSAQKGAEIFTEAMGDVSGATETAANKIEDTTSVAWQKVSTMWTDFRLGIGQVVTDIADQSLKLLGIVETQGGEMISSVTARITEFNEAWAAMPGAVTGGAAQGNRWYVPGTDPNRTGFRPNVRNQPINRNQADWQPAFELMIADYLRSGDRHKITRVSELTGPDDPSLTRAEIEPYVWQVRNLLELSGYTAQEWASDTVTISTARTATAFNQRFPGSPFDQSLAAAGFGGGGGIGSAFVGGSSAAQSPIGQMATATYIASQEVIQALTGPGGLGSAVDDNTTALVRNTEMLEATSERLIEVVYNPNIGPPGLLTSTDPRHFTRLNAANRGRHLLTRIP